MRLIAKDNFQPPGVARPVRAGEILDVPVGVAADLIASGLAVPAPPDSPLPGRETMVKEPKERRGRKKTE